MLRLKTALFIDAQFHTLSSTWIHIMVIQGLSIKSDAHHFGLHKNAKYSSRVLMIGQSEFGTIRSLLESNAS